MTKNATVEHFRFGSIPGQCGGRTILTIYGPGTFFGGNKYAVFVGGCGVGDRNTLAEAKALLLERAIAYCDRQIVEANRTIIHYGTQRARLMGGLPEAGSE